MQLQGRRAELPGGLGFFMIIGGLVRVFYLESGGLSWMGWDDDGGFRKYMICIGREGGRLCSEKRGGQAVVDVNQGKDLRSISEHLSPSGRKFNIP
jgi:hypothetical protein